MQVTKELIEAFFAHQCTPGEGKRVSEYLKAHPEEMEKYLPADDWQSSDIRSLLPETFWDKQWERIQAQKNGGRVFVMMKRVAVAAIFLLAVGASVFYLVRQSAPEPAIVAAVAPEFKSVTNRSDSVMTIFLADGSAVALEPHASLTYKEGFEDGTRDLSLRGEAVFSVAKDPNRPFTVYSGDISTTALGTKFKVMYWGGNEKAKVYLYEGKVVVRAINAKNKKESFLLPGDMLSYNNEMISVERSAESLAGARTQKADNSSIAASTSETEQNISSKLRQRKAEKTTAVPLWYKFEKESVANVFDQLSALYGVTIDYDAEVLKHKYFIGRFEEKNPIDNILKTIAELNHLQVEKVGEGHYKIK